MEYVIDDPELVYAITYAVGDRGGIQAAAHDSSVATVLLRSESSSLDAHRHWQPGVEHGRSRPF